MEAQDPGGSPFAGLLGVEWLSDDPDDARARLELRDELKQPYGYLHGGVILAIVDELCSRCTVIQVLQDGMVGLAQNVNVSMLRSIKEGTLTVSARARHRGKSSWVWDAEAADDQGRLCALAKVTIAVRPLERPA